MSTVLPEPVAPTRATVSPGRISRSTPRSTEPSESGKAKSTRLEAQVAERLLDDCGHRTTMSGSVSKISRIRALAVIASWAIARITPSEATGQTRESSRVMNATSSPGREQPLADPDRAGQQHDDDGEVRDHLEEGPELRREPDLVHRGAVELSGGGFVLARDVVGAAERLDDPDADRALLGQRSRGRPARPGPGARPRRRPSRSASTARSPGSPWPRRPGPSGQ